MTCHRISGLGDFVASFLWHEQELELLDYEMCHVGIDE